MRNEKQWLLYFLSPDMQLKATQCDTSVRLSICEEWHYENTKFSQRLWTELCESQNLADQQCFTK